MVNNIKDLFQDVSFILKFAVMIILIVATIFAAPRGIYHAEEGTHELLVIGVYTYLIIIIGLLVLYIFDEPHQLYNLVHMIVGGVIDVVVGILCLIAWGDLADSDSDGALRTLIVGVLVLAAGVIMITDFILVLVKK